jgi:ADP-ribosyl-[dinitrogen reductase] hydrolase
LAIGDSLGNTSEGMPPSNRRAYCGEIRDYLPNHHAGGRPVGLPSDDTQMAFWTLEHLLEHDGLVPERLAERFCREHIYGIGRTVRGFIRAFKDEEQPWYAAGPHSAGNGALMRIAPVIVPYLAMAGRPTSALWADAAPAATITHNDASSTAACVAFVGMLWRLLEMRQTPEPEWWIDAFCDIAAPLEGEVQLASRVPGKSYSGPLWRFVDTQVRAARRDGLPTREACNRWHSGAYLLETVPSVLYVRARHGQDAEETIVRAVNDTWDNDTVGAVVGAVVGAAVGALYGRAALPERWVAALLGRTSASDNGRVFELIAASRERWGKLMRLRGDESPPARPERNG